MKRISSSALCISALTFFTSVAAFAADDLPQTWMTTRGKLLVSEDFAKPLAPFTGQPVGFRNHRQARADQRCLDLISQDVMGDRCPGIRGGRRGDLGQRVAFHRFATTVQAQFQSVHQKSPLLLTLLFYPGL